MSSTNYFSYKMKKGQWAKADALNESDIAVIIDINMEIFWFWEGTHSTARDRYNARQILGQLRKKYTSYRFKRINKEASEDVRDQLELLQIHALARKKSDKKNIIKNLSNIFHTISLINCTLIIITIILLTSMFFQFQAINPDLYINQNNFISIFVISSLLLLLSFILFIISATYSGISRNTLLLIISIIGCCLIFIPFFILRIWDVILIHVISNEQYIFQNDAIFFFIFSMDIFLVLNILCSLSIGIMGFMNVSLIRKKEFEKLKE